MKAHFINQLRWSFKASLMLTLLVSLGIGSLASIPTNASAVVTLPTSVAGPGVRVPDATLNKYHLSTASTSTTSNKPVYFQNWSGYAVSATKKFTKIQATFVQPAVTCPTPNAMTVFWVGFDGFSNNTVEQAGTAAQCGGGTNPIIFYFAWWDMYPTTNLQPISTVAVAPGNTVQLTVSYNAAKAHYTMTVANLTTSKSFSQTSACGSGLTCSRSSAEWIVERPYQSTGYTALANWNTMNLSKAQASTATTGTMQPISKFSNTPIDMISTAGTGQTLASVAPLTSTGNQFSDTWKAAQ